ncbi:MAG: glyoxalase [Litorilinea sp.]|nr:MAG: glyoxalase [Litorilinea sp.]
MTIHPETTMGMVTLCVADLGRSLDYYRHRIGLQLHRQEGGAAFLGAGGPDLLCLVEQPGARPVQRGRTGLYHFALLLPSRLALARTLRHLLETRTPIAGASDHGVSEALYLTDPDGHGIEIYRDRPRAEWPMVSTPRGMELAMTVDPLDVEGILAELAPGDGGGAAMPAETTVGHVHLHVAELEAAEAFYCGVLGFTLMQRFDRSASFVSAGGYHHHLGLNIWAGRGAPPPPEDAARLLHYEIVLPDAEALEAVLARIQAAGLIPQARDGGWFLHDPSRNGVVLRAGR